MQAITCYLLIFSLAWTSSRAQTPLPTVELRFRNGELRNIDDIRLGSRVEIICNVTGAAIDNITWYQDSTAISETRGSDIMHRWIISSFSEEHAGNYTCAAGITSVGTLSSNTVILEAEILTVMARTEPRVVTVVEGQPQAIDCLIVDSSHPVNIFWEYVDGRRTEQIELQYDLAVESTNQSLVVVNPTSAHMGHDFRCSADPVDGPFGYIQLNYQATGVAVPLSIVSPPRDVVTVRGERVKLECIQGGTGAERERSIWTVPNNYTRNIRELERGFILSISSVRDENVGVYTCTDGRTTVTAQLSVIDPPVISNGLSELPTTVIYGDPILLTCSTLPNPLSPTRWEWFHNGRRLFDQAGSTMLIESATLEHSGTYQCMAYNPAGVDSSATTVQVRTIAASISEELPPSQLVFRDHPFTFNCSASGAPPPRYTWLKGTTPLETSSSFLVDSTEGSLIINNVEASSDGRYECRAENSLPSGDSLGSSNTSTLLISIRPTVIQRQPGEIFSVQVGTMTIIPCEASRDMTAFLSYSWTKDGSPLSMDSRVQFSNPSMNGDLSIGQVEFEDAGIYQCSVVTNRGRLIAPVVRSMNTSLTVTETPVAPIITFVSTTSVNSFHVRWNFLGPVASVSNYTIEVQPSLDNDNDPWVPLHTRFAGAITVANVSSNALMPFTEYRVRVVAAYTSGVRVPSQFMVITTEESTPTDGPGNLNGEPTPNNTAILLSWDPPSEPRGLIIDYMVQYREKDEEEEYMSDNVGSNTTLYLINGLKQFHMYEVRVAGVTAAGVGVFSGVISVHLNHANLEEPESGPFVTSIGFIVLVVAVVVTIFVTLVVAILVVKRKAVKNKKARNYALRHSGYFGKDNVIDMECIDTNLSESTMSSYRSGRKRGFSSPTGSRQDAMERESSIGNGTEFTMTGTPQLSTASSTTRFILHNSQTPSYIDAPSYIDPPSFEETVMKTRSRSQSTTSASYKMENSVPITNAEWDNEQESKIDYPISGLNGVVISHNNIDQEFPYEESENSTEKNPVESVFSDDTDALSDHTQYSHLAPVVNNPTSPVSASISFREDQFTVQTNPSYTQMTQAGKTSSTHGRQQEIFHHHHIKSASKAESRGTPTNFEKMVQNRLSIQSVQSEDEGSALSYATYV